MTLVVCSSMAISVFSEISTTLDDVTLERLSITLETEALQVRYGIELASREILDYLAREAGTPEGAQRVYTQMSQFDGSLLGALGQTTDPFALVTSKASLAGVEAEFADRLVNDTRVNSDITHQAAQHVVTIASVITMDALGLKVTEGKNAAELAQILFAQTGTNTDAMAITDTCPVNAVGPTPVNLSELKKTAPTAPLNLKDIPSSAPDDEKFSEVELTASVLPESNIPSGSARLDPKEPEQVLKATKTDPVDFSQNSQEKRESRRMGATLVVGGVLAILATGVYSWKVMTSQESQLTQLRQIVQERAQAKREEYTEHTVDPIQTLTKAVAVYEAPKASVRPSFSRHETDGLPVVVDWSEVVVEESSREFSWDTQLASEIEEGKVSIGPWKVAREPRNRASSSCFRFEDI